MYILNTSIKSYSNLLLNFIYMILYRMYLLNVAPEQPKTMCQKKNISLITNMPHIIKNITLSIIGAVFSKTWFRQNFLDTGLFLPGNVLDLWPSVCVVTVSLHERYLDLIIIYIKNLQVV
jgi:hypothetical protein